MGQTNETFSFEMIPVAGCEHFAVSRPLSFVMVEPEKCAPRICACSRRTVHRCHWTSTSVSQIKSSTVADKYV